jgi:hypothetical protein
MQRNANHDRNGHQRKEERPGVEKEEQRVTAVDKKRDTQRQ